MMAAKITQFAFDELDAPPVVVGARNRITPADEVYETSRESDVEDLLRHNREGV